MNLEEKYVTDEIARIKSELAEKKHTIMTKEISMLTAQYVEATNEMKGFVLDFKGENLEADPTLRTLREAVRSYRESLAAASNRPGSPTRVISPSPQNKNQSAVYSYSVRVGAPCVARFPDCVELKLRLATKAKFQSKLSSCTVPKVNQSFENHARINT